MSPSELPASVGAKNHGLVNTIISSIKKGAISVAIEALVGKNSSND
jgi:hypothetical protein